MDRKIMKFVAIAVCLGLMVCLGTIAANAQVTFVPCTHSMHAFDMAPCAHPMHPYGDAVSLDNEL